jgi:hypothetical protein
MATIWEHFESLILEYMEARVSELLAQGDVAPTSKLIANVRADAAWAAERAEFDKRAVGIVVASYVKDNALMGIVRICNDHALRVIQSGAFETRLAAVFDDDAASVDVDAGRMCVEPPPRYLSHLSLVPEGAVEFEFGFTLVNPEAKAA